MEAGETFSALAERLSAASVQRRWEAYRDVDWADPDNTVDQDDPRWEVPPWDPLGASEWYRDQSNQRRSEIGLFRTMSFLKVGIEFDSFL
jgi:hypothetical protein